MTTTNPNAIAAQGIRKETDSLGVSRGKDITVGHIKSFSNECRQALQIPEGNGILNANVIGVRPPFLRIVLTGGTWKFNDSRT
jgi:hypothetical protein